MALTIEQFRCRADNYGVLVHHDESGETLSIDAPEAAAIDAALTRNGWRLGTILVTHHHGDHTAGNLELKERHGCTILGPAREAARIPGIDRPVDDRDTVAVLGTIAHVLATPGHTLGHVSYFLPDADVVFVGDTLFAMGCGRLLEGTPDMMWASLSRLRDLPPATRFYCGHDYAAANARFALTLDPDNRELARRAAEVTARTAEGLLNLPSTIGSERNTNPFLRADDRAITRAVGMPSATPSEVFAEIRRRKDKFS